ncbi:uncharacterized protein LOC128931603 [Callithrix jacchus]
MVPPARGARKGDQERESPAQRAAGRQGGVAAPSRSERPSALRPAKPHIPCSPSAQPRPRSPAPRLGCSCQAPADGGGEGGDGTGRGGAGHEGAGPSAEAMPPPPLVPWASPLPHSAPEAREPGWREGARETGKGAGRPASPGRRLDVSGRKLAGPQPAAPPLPPSDPSRPPLAAVDGAALPPTAH